MLMKLGCKVISLLVSRRTRSSTSSLLGTYADSSPKPDNDLILAEQQARRKQFL